MSSNRDVTRAAKLRGLTLQAAAVRAIVRTLKAEAEGADVADALSVILDAVKEHLAASSSSTTSVSGAGGGGRGGSGGLVTEEAVASVIADLSSEEGDLEKERFQLMGALATPKLCFEPSRRLFQLEPPPAAAAAARAKAALAQKGKNGGEGAGGFHLPEGSLHAGALDKVAMLRERFLLVQQRVSRHPHFAKPLVATAPPKAADRDRHGGGGGGKAYVELTPIDALLGMNKSTASSSSGGDDGGRPRSFYLLGIIIEGAVEGAYHLEDLHATVLLDLSLAAHQQITTPGFFTETCIVIAEGTLTPEGAFRVEMMGFPPPEQRVDSLEATGHLDLFQTGITPQQWTKVQALEATANDAMFVLLSDVFLDRPMVMDKLRTLLEGFAQVTPLPLFVLMGDFSATPVGYGKDGAAKLEGHFRELADLIVSVSPRLAAEGRFVLVPGPNDPGCGATLPRAPIASKFTVYLRDKVPHAACTTNPCRLRFYAQEIVIFREDVLKKMKRLSLLPLSVGAAEDCGDPPSSEPRATGGAMDEDGAAAAGGAGDLSQSVTARPMDETEHLVKTLLDQGHLCPLPLSARPVHWRHDHTLRLYPLPDLLVCADRSEQYNWRYEDCLVLNPGSFPTDYSFVVYRPASFEVEYSRI